MKSVNPPTKRTYYSGAKSVSVRYGGGVKRLNKPEIKNLKKAADRIKKAIKKEERIILYGDADMDGVASVIILKEAIANLGGKVIAVYFPDRETEGYGINEDALNYSEKHSPALFITVDLGIGNFKEVKLAKKLGFEVMIVDHHKVLNKLPAASIIVNPKQKGDSYPFKEFAAAGVVFKLAEALLGEKLTPALRNNFLELAALATIADMMTQEEDNIEIVTMGLASLKNTFRPGLKVFTETDENNSRAIAQKIISACHAAGTASGHINEAYSLLTSTSIKEAEHLAEELLEKSYERQQKIKEITEEAEGIISKKTGESIIFEGSKDWPILMAGPASSKICNIYKKPVFLYSQKEKDSQGAVRTPKGVDGVKPMIYCSKYLETYGGHPQAGGFRIKNKDLGKFKKCLIKYFQK
ncbi:MAG: DHH family phosphoesterase [Candidatus Nealsonbacteria bacterium]|nr:DHH family phosphoesterase [Candidatus Nealsonbacteria bacterium]